MHQFKPCRYCAGEAVYVHLPKLEDMPPEHQVVCNKCSYKTEVHRYSYGAVKEWNRRERK